VSLIPLEASKDFRAERAIVRSIELTHGSVPFVAIGQMIAIPRTQRTTDKTWERATQSVWEILVTFFSVICAIVPRSQQFWGSLQSGGIQITNANDFELSNGGRYKSSSRHSGQVSNTRSKQRFSKNEAARSTTAARPQRASEDSQRQLFSALHGGYGRSETKVQGPCGPIGAAQDRAGSDQGSDNVIHQTVEFSLRID